MKKVLSIALAVVMMFAVCVPAFAAATEVDITKDSDQSADVAVKTVIDPDDISYTVTVPADIEIAWGDTSEQDASYTVTTQLFAGDTLAVAVAANDSGVMTATDTTVTDTLTFALANEGTETFGAAVTDAAPQNAPAVSIADFSGKTVTEYVGTLTYTVTYTAA